MAWNVTSEILEGYSKYIHTSDEWEMTIGYTITHKSYDKYGIKVENKNEGITWIGTAHDGIVMKQDTSMKINKGFRLTLFSLTGALVMSTITG